MPSEPTREELLAALENLLGAWQAEYFSFFGQDPDMRAAFQSVPEVIAARAVIELAKRKAVHGK